MKKIILSAAIPAIIGVLVNTYQAHSNHLTQQGCYEQVAGIARFYLEMSKEPPN